MPGQAAQNLPCGDLAVETRLSGPARPSVCPAARQQDTLTSGPGLRAHGSWTCSRRRGCEPATAAPTFPREVRGRLSGSQVPAADGPPRTPIGKPLARASPAPWGSPGTCREAGDGPEPPGEGRQRGQWPRRCGAGSRRRERSTHLFDAVFGERRRRERGEDQDPDVEVGQRHQQVGDGQVPHLGRESSRSWPGDPAARPSEQAAGTDTQGPSRAACSRGLARTAPAPGRQPDWVPPPGAAPGLPPADAES